MVRAYVAILFVVSGILAGNSHRILTEEFQEQRQLDILETLPTSAMVKPVTLGFHAVASDYYYLKAIQHFGDIRYHYIKKPYPLLVLLLTLSTDLDPYFVKPYIMGGLTLTLRNMNPSVANELLRKGYERRPDNYDIASLLGFNLFYFEKNYKEAAMVLSHAAKMPEAPDYLPGLATRVAAQGGQPLIGIELIEQILPSIHNERLKKKMLERRNLLEIEVHIGILEQALHKFALIHGYRPQSLSELVAQGFLTKIPEEPFGGTYILDKNGVPASSLHPQRLRVFE